MEIIFKVLYSLDWQKINNSNYEFHNPQNAVLVVNPYHGDINYWRDYDKFFDVKFAKYPISETDLKRLIAYPNFCPICQQQYAGGYEFMLHKTMGRCYPKN